MHRLAQDAVLFDWAWPEGRQRRETPPEPAKTRPIKVAWQESPLEKYRQSVERVLIERDGYDPLRARAASYSVVRRLTQTEAV